MIQIVIPMAGNGQRFRDAGYTDPKPLISIDGEPMIRRVMDSLRPETGAQYVLVTQDTINCFGLGAAVLYLHEPTRGATDTLLRSERLVNNGSVIVANCDQLLTAPIGPFLDACATHDAGIVTFNSTNPHHSYVTVDSDDIVTRIAEKKVISDNALLGVYWFADSALLFDYARKTIAQDVLVNGEFYISSILDLMVTDGLRIRSYEVDVHDKHILGTPEELRIFLDKLDAGKVTL